MPYHGTSSYDGWPIISTRAATNNRSLATVAHISRRPAGTAVDAGGDGRPDPALGGADDADQQGGGGQPR